MSAPDWLRREVYGDPEPYEPSFAGGGIVRRHTARRPLSCHDCPSGRGIKPGERYTVFVGISDDDRDFFCERNCDGMPDECRAVLRAEERPAPVPARHAPSTTTPKPSPSEERDHVARLAGALREHD